MEATRIRLAEGVHLTYLPARKFKTSLLSAQFVTPLRRETAGANALLAAVLRRGTVSCPDMGALSAKMDNLEFFQKFRENFAYIIIDRGCAKTAADDHKYRFVSCETTEFASGFGTSGKKFLADWSSCKNGFVCRKICNCLRKITADFGC